MTSIPWNDFNLLSREDILWHIRLVQNILCWFIYVQSPCRLQDKSKFCIGVTFKIISIVWRNFTVGEFVCLQSYETADQLVTEVLIIINRIFKITFFDWGYISCILCRKMPATLILHEPSKKAFWLLIRNICRWNRHKIKEPV